MSVQLGSSQLIASGRLRGRRVGIVANPASVNASFTHIVDHLMREPEVRLTAIFGPQHGFRSDGQDNMIETPHGGDQVEGPILAAGFESFVGQFPIPIRHGMTIGELARYCNEHFDIQAPLEVAAVDSRWKTGLVSVATSVP